MVTSMYKTSFDLPRDLVDTAIKAHGAVYVRTFLNDAISSALRALATTTSERITAGLRVVYPPDASGVFVVWSDIVKLCGISNPSYYFKNEKRALTIKGRNEPMLTIPVKLAYDFLIDRRKRDEAFALCREHMPKIEYTGNVDEDGRSVEPVDDRSDQP